MSATGTFRNVRHQLRKRGVDLDRLLPLGGLAAGVLAGLLTWGVLRGWFLDYRAEVELRVGPPGRTEDAARAVIARVEDPGFQDAWFAAARAKDELCSHGRLQAGLIEPAEGEAHQIRLVCRGRPRGAARLALVQARDALVEPRAAGISPLLPTNHAERVADGDRLLGEVEKADAQARERKQARQEALDKAVEGKKAAQAAVDALHKKLEGTDVKVLTARRGELLDQRKKTASPADAPGALAEAEQQKLRADYTRLGHALREDSRRDSTADHPVVRRMTEIAHRLKLNDLDRDVAEIDRKLDRVRPLLDELEKAEAGLETAARAEAQAQKDLEGASNHQAQTAVGLSTRRLERAKLDSVSRTPVEVAAATMISDVVEHEWLFWACLGGGLAAGLLLLAVIRFRIEARRSQINSSSGLAHCLHLPVLGVVPDLGGLAAQRE